MGVDMTWTRLAIPAAGRSICHRPGLPDRLVLVARDGGYDATTASGTLYLTEAKLPHHLAAAGRAPPTADDLAWLRGRA